MLSFGKLFGYGIVFAFGLSLLHLLAANVLNIADVYIHAVVWILLVVLAIACVRRVGVINYFEAILVAFVWLLFALAGDKILTNSFVSTSVFRVWETWVGYGVSALAIFLFHQKRHVQIRRELNQQ